MQGYGVGRYHAVVLSMNAFGRQWASHIIQEAKNLLCKSGVLLVESLESASSLLMAANLVDALESSTGWNLPEGELCLCVFLGKLIESHTCELCVFPMQNA